MPSPRKKRYLLRDSDRSGYTYRDIELVNDNGSLVGGDEFDMPPPSNRLYAGEGDISPGFIRVPSDTYTTPPENAKTTQNVTPLSGVSVQFQIDNSNFQANDSIGAWMYVAGVSSTTVITKNPQISASNHGDKITLQCVSNNLVIQNNNGVRLYTSIFNMDSGAQLNLIYNSTDGLWHETSRGTVKGLIGGF